MDHNRQPHDATENLPKKSSSKILQRALDQRMEHYRRENNEESHKRELIVPELHKKLEPIRIQPKVELERVIEEQKLEEKKSEEKIVEERKAD